MNAQKLKNEVQVIPLAVTEARDVREQLKEQIAGIMKTARDEKRDFTKEENKTVEALRGLVERIDDGVFSLASGTDDEGGLMRPGSATHASEYRNVFADMMRSFAKGRPGELEQRGLTTTNSSGIIQDPLIMSTYVANLTDMNPLSELGVNFKVDQSNYSQFPYASGEPVVSYLSEGGSITADTAWAIGGRKATFSTSVCLIKTSRQLLMDNMDAAKFAQQELNVAFKNHLTKSIMQGSGSGQPTGLDNLSGINTVDMNGSAYDLDDYIDWSTTLIANRVRPNQIGFLHGSSSWGYAAKFKDSQNRYLDKPELLREQMWKVSSAVKEDYASTRTKIYGGDWSTIYAMFRQSVGRETPGYGGLQVLDQLYAETFEIGFLAWVNHDFVYHRPTSLIRIDGVPLT